MIFVTVGSELAFDRMVRVVDDWAAANQRTDVFAQIGDSKWQPRHIQFVKFLTPAEYARHFQSATRIIAHAGMGTILTALHYGKPIFVMPRRAAYKETRNDHQVATVRQLSEMGKIDVALDESALRAKLDQLDGLKTPEKIGPFAGPDLLAAIRRFSLEPKR